MPTLKTGLHDHRLVLKCYAIIKYLEDGYNSMQILFHKNTLVEFLNIIVLGVRVTARGCSFRNIEISNADDFACLIARESALSALIISSVSSSSSSQN